MASNPVEQPVNGVCPRHRVSELMSSSINSPYIWKYGLYNTLCSVNDQSWEPNPPLGLLSNEKVGLASASMKMPNATMKRASSTRYCINEVVKSPSTRIFGPKPSLLERYWNARMYMMRQIKPYMPLPPTPWLVLIAFILYGSPACCRANVSRIPYVMKKRMYIATSSLFHWFFHHLFKKTLPQPSSNIDRISSKMSPRYHTARTCSTTMSLGFSTFKFRRTQYDCSSKTHPY